MTEIHTLSFRAQLKGEIGDFIEKSGMACVETTKAMTDLIVELSHYEEECVTPRRRVGFLSYLP